MRRSAAASSPSRRLTSATSCIATERAGDRAGSRRSMAGGVCSRDAVERRMGALNALAGALLLPLSFGMVIGALRIASRRISGGRERSNSAEIDGLFVGFLVLAPPNVGVPGSRRFAAGSRFQHQPDRLERN